MSPAPLSVLATGDLILDEPDPASFFAPSAEMLRHGDVVIGHVEVPHTDRGVEHSTDIPAPAAPPEHLDVLSSAGFTVATLAGNHVFDQGAVGIEDTVARLRKGGVEPTGAGQDIEEARAPAVVERAGRTVGVLSYNCVGPKDSWAGTSKAGCAYVHVLTHYELDHASPGGPPTTYTFPHPDSLQDMKRDVLALRGRADVVVVAFHKGVGHVPAHIAMYERTVAHAAVDAGADMVISHHAHIMRGVEIYRDKPVFHGLGNFVTVTRALSLEGNASEARRAWARRRRELFGFEPEPTMPQYPFHPESRNTAVAHCLVHDDGRVEAGLIPCRIDDRARPVPVARDEGGADVVDYITQITARAELSSRLVWADDHRVIIEPAGVRP